MKNNINVEDYLVFLKFYVNKYHRRHIEFSSFDDVYQLGCVGMLNAAKNFDESKGIDFTTYSKLYISGEIKSFFRDKNDIVKFPRTIKKMSYKVKEIEEPTVEQIIEICNCSKEDAMLLIDYLNSIKSVSLDKQVGNGEDVSLQEVLVTSDDESELMLYLNDFLSTLDEKERRIIELKMEEKNQSDIAKELNMNQPQVCNKIKKIKQKLIEYSGGKLCIL